MEHSDHPPREIEIVDFLAQLFKSAGFATADSPKTPNQSERRADLAVWIDDLPPMLGKPLIIEVKRNVRDFRGGADHLRTFLAKTDSQLGLLIYWGERTDVVRPAISDWPLVLRLSVREVFDLVRTGTFASRILSLRNQAIHGLR